MWPSLIDAAGLVIQWPPLNTTGSLNCAEITEILAKIIPKPSAFTLILHFVNFIWWVILLFSYYYYASSRVSGTYELRRYYAHYVLYRAFTYGGRGFPWRGGVLHLGLLNFLLTFDLVYTGLCYANINGLSTWPLIIILIVVLIVMVLTLVGIQIWAVWNAPGTWRWASLVVIPALSAMPFLILMGLWGMLIMILSIAIFITIYIYFTYIHIIHIHIREYLVSLMDTIVIFSGIIVFFIISPFIGLPLIITALTFTLIFTFLLIPLYTWWMILNRYFHMILIDVEFLGIAATFGIAGLLPSAALVRWLPVLLRLPHSCSTATSGTEALRIDDFTP